MVGREVDLVAAAAQLLRQRHGREEMASLPISNGPVDMG
jgi:hypothetical protein